MASATNLEKWQKAQQSADDLRISAIEELRVQRKALMDDVGKIDELLLKLRAEVQKQPKKGGGKKRAEGEPSMGDRVLEYLGSVAQATVTQVVEAVKQHTTSSDPRSVVNQALTVLKKDGKIESIERGVYSLKG